MGVVKYFVTALVTAILSILLRGWFLMLGVAVVRDHWIPQVPGLGYWWACLLAILIGGAFTPVKTSSSSG